MWDTLDNPGSEAQSPKWKPLAGTKSHCSGIKPASHLKKTPKIGIITLLPYSVKFSLTGSGLLFDLNTKNRLSKQVVF
jgi:hypothetical protein